MDKRLLRDRRVLCSTAFVLSVVLCGAAILSASEGEQAHAYPLEYQSLVDGEKLEYKAGWNGIPAARATVSTFRDPEIPKLYRVSAHARSLGYVSRIWNMRDSIETRINPETYWPVSFVVSLLEKGRVDTRQCVFSYAEHVIRVVRQKRQTVQEYTIPIGAAYDALTAAFLLRAIELKVGDAPQVEVCEGKDIYLVRMDVVGMEHVKLGLGTFPAYRLKVSLKKLYPHERAPGKNKKFQWATLWLSADAARIPLKLESKVFVGNVYVELVSENRGLTKRYGQH